VWFALFSGLQLLRFGFVVGFCLWLFLGFRGKLWEVACFWVLVFSVLGVTLWYLGVLCVFVLWFFVGLDCVRCGCCAFVVCVYRSFGILVFSVAFGWWFVFY